ncbi:bacterio-opsin activator domain-containing protein [Halalkalicoccus jeotgali]|uniref:PAS/PAC sensor protein n=1 Tax=Halalkalicoccus jeotgali (strain DSM 18796 / CECT 7217 / JCM 14584 / KCTC 4019 / B3) TaxID=795797 RepID=D8J2X5_HALJB|nr:bacterio-opsin activator domain-containing protein [Halalkalicoccus jeotgali]ADJ15082.1 putative PAS/PAC sensor protein [Halalkalicoccus jeotgali B3]ELY34899.1 putative PAS/PAC sensor protein [Halalkalicoccus jeotgali B3]
MDTPTTDNNPADLKTVLDHTTEAVLTLDSDTRVTYCNEQAATVFDASREELLGRVLWRVVPDEIGTTFQKRCERAVGTRESVTFEARRSDPERWLTARVHPSPEGATLHLQDNTAEKRYERTLARNYERLTTLVQLNSLVRDLSHAVLNASSRDRVERRVCDRLVEEESYPLVWIGTVNRGEGEVTPTTVACSGDHRQYLDGVRISVEDADPSAHGPTGTAIRTREPQVVHDIRTATEYDPWRDAATEHDFTASAAFPLLYDDVLYGVLNVYATTTEAFDDPTYKALDHLSGVVGHAIHALEQRVVLTTDSVVELEFRNTELVDLFVPNGDVSNGSDDLALSVERTTPVEDGSLLQIITATGGPAARFVEAFSQFPSVEEVTVLSESELGSDGEGALLGLRVSEPSLSTTLAAYGGRIRDLIITSEDVRLIAEVPPRTDTRRITEALAELYPGTELLAQRTRSREELTRRELVDVLGERLTEKQRVALGTAYASGYFEWPRTATGEEVAAMLEVAPPTFAQHLRAAQRNLFTVIYERD